MVKVLIIADDFTGALDTGIQFAKRGIETQVLVEQELCGNMIAKTTQVLVVDSETRALNPSDAYRIVKNIACCAVAFGIPTILKKTDSALRGNIGAELKALADAVETKEIYFLPAYPEINRVTKKGIHYIDEQLLTDSAFGADPFEPVTHSDITALIHKQCDYPVEIIDSEAPFPNRATAVNTIYLFDAQKPQDMKSRTAQLKANGRLRALAGCAGLARHLPEVLNLDQKKAAAVRKTAGLYVACGSLNPITRAQVEYAVSEGCSRVNLTPEQKLSPEYYDQAQGREFLEKLYLNCLNHPVTIVDTFELGDKKATLNFADAKNIKRNKIRYSISASHGIIVKFLIERGLNYTILMTGGDTLMGVMKALDGAQLHPVGEVSKGVVVSRLEWQNREIQIISKSGGFGERQIITTIAEKMIERQRI